MIHGYFVKLAVTIVLLDKLQMCFDKAEEFAKSISVIDESELAEVFRERAFILPGQVVEDIEEHVAPDGLEIYVHVMKSPIRDSEGRIIGIQGIFWDVTRLKTLEVDLRETKRQLAAALERADGPPP